MIEELKKAKEELFQLLNRIGIYYEVREYDGEALKRYLLDKHGIFLHITHHLKNKDEEYSVYNRDGWHYDVIDLKDGDNCVSQDFQVYKTYDDVLFNGLIEAFAYVKLHSI